MANTRLVPSARGRTTLLMGSGSTVIAALAFGMAAVPHAYAQQGIESGPSGITDIVVTARRKEESLQSVPISVQAFSGELLAERNIQDATDLEKMVPSLTTYSQARDEVTLSIRGQSSSGASAQGQNPRVTAYFSEVPLQTGDGGGPGRFFDLQNVQILKGPQGTLFGRNSTGGAVLYEPTRPNDEWGGYFAGQLGRFHDREIEGAINVPVHETLAFRFSAKRAKRDGFTTNIVNGEELDDRNYFGGRASMLFTPSSNFENYTMFDYLSSNTNGSSQQIGGYNPNIILGSVPIGGGNVLPIFLAGNRTPMANLQGGDPNAIGDAIASGGFAFFPDPLLLDQLANQEKFGPRISQSGVDGLSKTKAWGITNITTLNVSDDISIKNVFGYRSYKQNSRYDMDGTAAPLLDQVTPDGDWSANLRQISNELQLQGSTLDGKLDFTVGGFLLWQKSPKEQRLVQVSIGGPSLILSKPKERSQAAFGQLTYDLSDVVTEGLSVTAGYRYTHDYREVVTSNYRDPNWKPGGTWNMTPQNCGLIGGCPTKTTGSFNASSYNFNIDWRVAPQTLVYVTHRKGYRAGGVNPQAYGFGDKYDPEKVTDFEAGLKTDFTAGGMEGRLNLAAFLTKLKDAQVSQSRSAQNPNNGQFMLVNMIVNAANADIKGLEADLTLVPFEGFDLSASYAYIDGKYKKFTDIATGQELTDRPFPFLAKHRLTVGARYTIPLSESIGDLSLGANWSYSSKYTIAVVDDPIGVQKGFGQLDLRADLHNIDNRDITLGFFVNNVTKALYKIGGVPIYTTLGTTSLLYSEPRTWGIQLRHAFGGK